MPKSFEIPNLSLAIAIKSQICAPGTISQLSLTQTIELPSTLPIFSSQAMEVVERKVGLLSLRLVKHFFCCYAPVAYTNNIYVQLLRFLYTLGSS